MGADLPKNPTPLAFSVYEQIDELGANLDRIQIINGWVDENGDLNEEIIDVVWSGKHQIGAASLIGSRTDNNFDPKESAFYYVGVLEFPTPHWSNYDTVRNGIPLQ
jgi:hypothetical protein